MKIRENTAERLVLEEVPTRIAAFLGAMTGIFAFGTVKAFLEGETVLGLIALVCLLVLAGLMIALLERVRVVFDARSGSIEVTRRNWRGRQVQRYAISALEGIALEEEDGSHRIVLYLAGRPSPVPLTGYLAGGPRMKEGARAAGDWWRRHNLT